MGQGQGDDVVEALGQEIETGKNEVHPGLGLLGEQHTTVYEQDLAVDLEGGHVATDVSEATERNDSQSVARQLRRSLQLSHIVSKSKPSAPTEAASRRYNPGLNLGLGHASSLRETSPAC